MAEMKFHKMAKGPCGVYEEALYEGLEEDTGLTSYVDTDDELTDLTEEDGLFGEYEDEEAE